MGQRARVLGSLIQGGSSDGCPCAGWEPAVRRAFCHLGAAGAESEHTCLGSSYGGTCPGAGWWDLSREENTWTEVVWPVMEWQARGTYQNLEHSN